MLAEEGLKHFQIPTARSCSEHNKPIEDLKSKNGLIQKGSFFAEKYKKTDTTLSIVSVAIERGQITKVVQIPPKSWGADN